MSDILFIDAAFPPKSMDGATGLVFYAGGDTPHVWSPADIERLNATYLLPTWVRSNPVGIMQAESDAATFVNALITEYHTPKGVLVALDSETSADSVYVGVFVRALNAAGYPVIDYGSESTVFGNNNPDGYYWGADWTGHPGIRPGEDATQYVSFADHDLSDFGGKLPLWKVGKPVMTPVVSTENGFTVQGGWRFCVKCKCLVHAPEGESAPCAGGGVHALHSHNYLILFSDTLL